MSCIRTQSEFGRRISGHRDHIHRRQNVAVYGHDFTVRAGSMDATNGKKLARLFELAAKRRIPLVGLNDSAGAYIPARVGGLDGYADAFTALRNISGIASIMCMFGFNAGGGSYLPRQGSFLIQPKNTFFGLTGPGVVKSVLGEDITLMSWVVREFIARQGSLTLLSRTRWRP